MKKWLVVMALAACGGGGEPADPATAQADVEALLPDIVDDTSFALADADDSDGIAGTRDSMDELNRSFADLPFRFPFGREDAAKLPADDEHPGATAARWLQEHVLTAANYEGEGVYRIHGAAVCDEGDADCVAAVDEAELRVRATRAGGGLDLVLLVGPERSEPLAIELRRNSIDVAIDLAEAKRALLHLARVAGEDIQLPATMRGTVALTLARLGPRHASLALAVREAIEVAGSAAKGPYHVAIAARDPLASVELDGPARRFAAVVNVGPVAIDLPWRVVRPDSKASGALAIDLRGVTADILVDATGLAATGLSFGPLTAKLDGKTLLGVDVKRFSLHVLPQPVGLPRLVLDPGLDAQVTVALQPLAAAGDSVESWALDEVFKVTAGQEVQPVAGALKSVKGSIVVAALKAGASVTVPEGQCLRGDPLTAGEHPVLGRLAAGACP